MKIDSHQHFWKFDPIRHEWIDDSMSVIKSDFLPKDLESILKKNSIDGSILVQTDQTEKENDDLLHLAEQNNFIKAVVGWVDLRDKNVEECLAHYSKNIYFKGVRHIVQSEEQDFLLREDFQNGIGKLRKFNLTYDILIFPNQLESAIQLVKKFPSQKFILDHSAKPDIKNQRINFWKRQIEILAESQNVFCKISGIVTEANLSHWEYEDFTPYLNVVFNAFGEDRLMFGSDWPVCLLAASYKEVYDLILNYINDFSEHQKAKLLGLNALRIYNITD